MTAQGLVPAWVGRGRGRNIAIQISGSIRSTNLQRGTLIAKVIVEPLRNLAVRSRDVIFQDSTLFVDAEERDSDAGTPGGDLGDFFEKGVKSGVGVVVELGVENDA